MTDIGTLETILKHLDDDGLRVDLNVEPGSELHHALRLAQNVYREMARGGGYIAKTEHPLRPGHENLFAIVKACAECKTKPLMLMPTGEMSDFCACCSDMKARTLVKVVCAACGFRPISDNHETLCTECSQLENSHDKTD